MSRSHINSSFSSGTNSSTPVAPNRSRRRAQSIGNPPNRNISAVNTTPRGSLFNSGSNDEGTGQLRIKIVAGHTLAKKDIFGASDPYVRIDLNTINNDINIDSVLTKTKKKTLNPIWNEEFVFKVKPTEHKLVFQVFDENRLTRDDFLGMVELTLVNLPKEQEGRSIPPKNYQLRPRRSVGVKSKVRGNLEIYHAYVRDLDASTTSEPDWEVVDSETSGINGTSFGSTAGLDPLPTGWEERQDANGRTYYVNHVARTTQWERPTLISDRGSSVSNNTAAAAAAEQFHRRFHISVDETDSRSNQDLETKMNEILENISDGLEDEEDDVAPEDVEDDESDRNDENSINGSDITELELDEANVEFDVPVIYVEGDAISLNSELGRNPSITGSITSLHQLRQSRNDFNRSGSVSSNHSSGRPVRPAPAVPRNSQRRQAPIPPPRLSTADGGVVPESSATNERTNRNEEQSNSENEDLDTSDSSTTNNNAASSSPQSRQSSIEEQTAAGQTAENLEAGLPNGWTMQVAPNGRIFYIDHNEKKTSWVDPRTGRASPMPNAAANQRKIDDDLGPLPESWEERVHSDGRIFYIDHTNRTTQWEDPRLSNPQIAGQAVPYSRDYKQKYEYFKSQLRKPANVPNKLEIKVRRGSILEDSYRVVSAITKTDLLKTKLWIEFEGEAGLDYGGLAREWFFLLSKEMFNPYYGLYEYSAMDNYTLQINPFSGLCNEEHLNYFKFIGRIAGMAVYHGKLLDAFFIRPFYKMMLQKPIDIRDMESVDMEYYNSLLWIKENDPSELVLTFCVDEETFGHTSQRELKPNGESIDVTNENKDEYIRLVIEWRFVSRVKEQMASFLEGFGSVVPLHLLKIFDANELELLMCGIQNIDVKDWKQNTLYKGDYHPNHILIQWFWRAVLSFSNEMRSRLLQFVTGTSRVPMNGFKELHGSNGPQMFTIEKWGLPENFPRAHTCFNRLDLPPYESYAQLKDKLIKAIEGSQGFAGVD